MPSVTPWRSVNVSKYMIPAYESIPNSSIVKRPVYHYHGVFGQDVGAGEMEAYLRKQGVVEPAWRYTMFNNSHFHANTHEVLAIAQGSATCLFGGDDASVGTKVDVAQGDVVIVPAGIAHRLWRDHERENKPLLMVGAYPVFSGGHWDMHYGNASELKGVEAKIKEVAWFERDPIYGDEGAVLEQP